MCIRIFQNSILYNYSILYSMLHIWEAIKNYYTTIGYRYHVNPVIFLGIHIVATPFFLLSVAWLIKNYRQKKELVLPAIVSVFIFNAANIYLIIAGKKIPWWIYTFLVITTIISGYFSFLEARKKMKK